MTLNLVWSYKYLHIKENIQKYKIYFDCEVQMTSNIFALFRICLCYFAQQYRN
jgi:hypothetical protein